MPAGKKESVYSMNQKRVLIFGGHGFIGSRLAKRFAENGHDVLIVDNRTHFNIIDETVSERVLQQRLEGLNKVPYRHIDVSCHDLVQSTLEMFRPDIVVQAADISIPKIAETNPHLARARLYDNTCRIADFSAAAGVNRFVYLSSSMVYGVSGRQRHIETDKPQPVSIYGYWKMQAEEYICDLFRHSDTDFTICRPMAVYGPGDIHARVVTKICEAALADGRFTVNDTRSELNFTHVDDAARGIYLAAMHLNGSNNIFNIGHMGARTLLELVRAVESSMDGSLSVDICSGVLRREVRCGLNVDKAARQIGFSAAVDLEAGVAELMHLLRRQKMRLVQPEAIDAGGVCESTPG